MRVTSENEGRQKMKRAAKIRNDVVAKRIKSLKGYEVDDDSCMFVYHNNNACYKTYTHKNKLKAIEAKHKETVVTVDHKGDEAVASVGSSGVGGDMKVEQTIQRVSKGLGDIT